MTVRRAIPLLMALSAVGPALPAPAQAQQRCHREGMDVNCDDGHRVR